MPRVYERPTHVQMEATARQWQIELDGRQFRD